MTKKNLEIRALKISSILSSEPANRIEKMKENFKEQNKNKIHSIRNSSNHINERRRNMRLIEDIAMAEVWYVDAKTGEHKLPHHITMKDGHYKGKQVFVPKSLKQTETE